MKYSKEETRKTIEGLVNEGKNEDAILCVIYELSNGKLTNVGRIKILDRLNEFLKRPFTMEDLRITLDVLKEKKYISGFNE